MIGTIAPLGSPSQLFICTPPLRFPFVPPICVFHAFPFVSHGGLCSPSFFFITLLTGFVFHQIGSFFFCIAPEARTTPRLCIHHWCFLIRQSKSSLRPTKSLPPICLASLPSVIAELTLMPSSSPLPPHESQLAPPRLCCQKLLPPSLLPLDPCNSPVAVFPNLLPPAGFFVRFRRKFRPVLPQTSPPPFASFPRTCCLNLAFFSCLTILPRKPSFFFPQFFVFF